MKLSYTVKGNFSMPIADGVETTTPSCAVEATGTVELTPEEYKACLEATVQQAKEAAEVWRPIAVDIVKSALLNTSFKEFCSLFWQKAKNMIGGGVFGYRAPED